MPVPFLFSHWPFCGTLGKSLVSLSLGFLVAQTVLTAPISLAHTVAELCEVWFDSV